jgi:choline dehydrogenase-like flavoprotein
MIIDSRTIARGTVLRADLCIVGAGAAGIAIAREFVNHPWRVILLESGGTRVRAETQSLNRGDVTGYPYPSLEVCRRRILGGSTTIWGGWCRPLDCIDFEERAWLPYSGWPFSRNHLQSQYARACAVCEPGRNGTDRESPTLQTSRQLLNPIQNNFEDILFHVAGTRFGETYWAELEGARNLSLMLHASALEVLTDRNCKEVVSVRVATLAGNHFSVSARNCILAAGGIENPRILLASRQMRSSGIGNENDVVGRYFADHLHLKLRSVVLNGRQVPDCYQLHKIGEQVFRGGMALTEEVRRRDKLLGFAITIHNADDPFDVVYPPFTNTGYASLHTLAKSLLRGELPDQFAHHFSTMIRHLDNAVALSFRKVVKPRWRALVIGCRAEQSPNPNSRIVLDHEKDAFGVNKVRVDWRLTQQDEESLRRARQILDNEWNFPGKDTHKGRAADEHATEITAAAHHMGTTRMHRDPKLGVVDETCRVHGIRNLYIAGSSVFPTTGWAPPTLTVIALALRLADSLKQSQP